MKTPTVVPLRDYFAAQVICGLIYSDAITERDDPQAEGFARWSTRMSEEAYSIADAMLRAREQVKP